MAVPRRPTSAEAAFLALVAIVQLVLALFWPPSTTDDGLWLDAFNPWS